MSWSFWQSVAWLLWKGLFFCTTVLFFIDNNGVRDSTIQGRIDDGLAELLLQIIINAEMSVHAIPWYTRIPSPSNPSDSLSRGACEAYDSNKRVGDGHLSKSVLRKSVGSAWSDLRQVEDTDYMA